MSDDASLIYVILAAITLMVLGAFLIWGFGGCLFAIGLGALLLALKG